MFIVRFTVQFRGWADEYEHVAIYAKSDDIKSKSDAEFVVKAKYHNAKTSVRILSVTEADSFMTRLEN